MKKLFSLFTLTILAFSAVYAQDCVATYGVASVTFTRDGAQYKTGHFSVSPTKSVKFAPGNLAYTEANGFYFFENQYDYSYNKNNVYDLFAYGASGYGETTPTGGNYAIGNLYDDDGTINNYDWGAYNPITHTKGGQTTTYPAGAWRTLTWSEWYYLGHTRTNHTTLMGGAKVNGIFGVILLPDDWVAPSDLPTFVASFAFTDVGDVNDYDTDEWSIFENAGAVFLPAVGNTAWGYEPPAIATQAYCSYWSANTYDEDQGKRADFGNTDRNFREVDSEKTARSSVRLVQDW
ncbi:MAG: hypothetical protein IJP50_05370 [Paludibacteraceae bacterium]|nr:hypothetical protein [Paludibacteraceae bacterium]